MTLDDLCSDEPTPDLLVALDEEFRNAMTLLRDDVLREIAEAVLQGYSSQDIAARLKLSVRTVQRKLSLIRATWSDNLASS